MTEDGGVVKFAFFIVFGFLMLLLVIISLLSIPLRTKASANVLTLRLKMQGNYKALDTMKAHIDFYNGPQKATSAADIVFSYDGSAFNGNIALPPGFDFTSFYALFIKPEKFVGRVFCNKNVTGKACTTPQMIFLTSGSTMDFSDTVFLGGDVTPSNGKVDAQDMSLIMKNLGKTAGSETDINNDGITDVVDYSLALYSLSQNAGDDQVQLGVGPTPTITPTGNTTPSATPAVTATPSITNAPTVTPSVTPTSAPTLTPIPPTLTPTPAPAKCHISPPSGYGDPFDLEAGKTSECGCESAPLIGEICSTITCKTCPSGTCNCSISATKLPSYTETCTNGGSFSVNKVSKCN